MASEKEQYVVSARKYRPQTFDTVVGQEHITTTLKNAIRTKHLAHAYLFCGPRGVGKTTCARILARTLNCENPDENMEACGKCSTCLAFKNNSALNIFELDAASNNSVEDIRRLTEQVRYAPQHGAYKIYIIDEVHMLSASAFNAFLKTLEEPPSYAIFILATTEKHKILPTILSRCQIFDFKRIKPEAIVHHLQEIAEKEHIATEEAALHVIAQKSEGCLRDALSLLDRLAGFSEGKLTYEEVIEHLNILDAAAYFRLSELLWSKDVGGAILFLDELLQKGFEGSLILNGFAEHFRNLLLCRDKRMAKLLELPEGHKRQFFEHAQLISEAYIVTALGILNEAELSYKNALNKRLHVELCLIRLCYLNDLVNPGNIPNNSGVDKAVKKNLNPTFKLSSEYSESSDKGNTVTESTETDSPSSSPSESDYNNKGKSKPVTKESQTPSVEDKAEAKPQNAKKDIAGVEKKRTKQTKPKMSSNLLSELQAENNSEEAREKEDLSPELAASLFTKFKEQLRETNLVLAEQMGLMTIHFENMEELHLLCSSEINLSYGKTAASEFRAFVQENTFQPALKVIPRLDPDAKPVKTQVKFKNKQDIVEDFMVKNPALKKLKEQLNLTIDY